MSQYLFGIHAVKAALAAGQPIHRLHVLAGRTDKRLAPLRAAAAERNIAVEERARRELDTMVEGARHQGVIAELAGELHRLPEDLDTVLAGLQGPGFFLVLDGVQDPHNLGACLRTANAAGVDAVIVPKDRSAGLTPAARKVAVGAAETTPLLQVTNLARTLRQLADAGVWIVGAAGEADTSLYAADLAGPLALVLGAEGSGLRRLTREHCDLLVQLPMAGSVESLNVSVAAGVCLYEAVRQRSTR